MKTFFVRSCWGNIFSDYLNKLIAEENEKVENHECKNNDNDFRKNLESIVYISNHTSDKLDYQNTEDQNFDEINRADKNENSSKSNNSTREIEKTGQIDQNSKKEELTVIEFEQNNQETK